MRCGRVRKSLRSDGWTHLVEGVSEHDQLVQQTPERPEVRREVVRLAANHLLRAGVNKFGAEAVNDAVSSRCGRCRSS